MTTLRLVPGASEARQTWEKRLSVWRSLRSDLNAHRAGTTLPGSPQYNDLEADMDALSDFCSAGEQLLMRTPAPDAEALLEKMDIWWEIQGSHRNNANDVFAIIRADVERFAKGTARESVPD